MLDSCNRKGNVEIIDQAVEQFEGQKLAVQTRGDSMAIEVVVNNTECKLTSTEADDGIQ
jgi:hypothetical protein